MTQRWCVTLCHPMTHPHTKFGIPTPKNIGDMHRTRSGTDWRTEGHCDYFMPPKIPLRAKKQPIVNHSHYKCIRKHIVSCHEKGEDIHRIIIWTILEGSTSQKLHIKSKGYWPPGSGEERLYPIWTWRLFSSCNQHTHFMNLRFLILRCFI